MINTFISGIKKNSNPLSEAFTLDVINTDINVDNIIHSINKIIVSSSFEFLDTFTSLNKNYVNIFIKINIRVDYLCNLKNINYQIHKIEKITSICTGESKCNNFTPIKLDILDANVININDKTLTMYLVYLLSIDIN